MRRIIIHAGFNKTGTTSLQQTLRAYSLSRQDYDLGMVKYEAAMLIEALKFEKAKTIIITSKDLSGHMPGRHKPHGYGAALHLMRAISDAFKAASPEDELTFFFTTRSADPWLRSCYAQNVRADRMVWDEGDYMKRRKTSANHDQTLDLIKGEIADHALIDAALEEYADRPLGMAEALLDHLGMGTKQRASLVPSPEQNAALPEALTQELLALNRSDLEDTAQRRAKRALIEAAA